MKPDDGVPAEENETGANPEEKEKK